MHMLEQIVYISLSGILKGKMDKKLQDMEYFLETFLLLPILRTIH